MNISKRDRKILTIGIGAVVLFLVFTYVISPFIESENDIRERTQQREMLLQKYEKIISQRKETEKKLTQIKRQQGQLSKKLLKGK